MLIRVTPEIMGIRKISRHIRGDATTAMTMVNAMAHMYRSNENNVTEVSTSLPNCGPRAKRSSRSRMIWRHPMWHGAARCCRLSRRAFDSGAHYPPHRKCALIWRRRGLPVLASHWYGPRVPVYVIRQNMCLTRGTAALGFTFRRGAGERSTDTGWYPVNSGWRAVKGVQRLTGSDAAFHRAARRFARTYQVQGPATHTITTPPACHPPPGVPPA